MTYYSGYPYSDRPVRKPSLSRKWNDELYHHGVPDQKWGVRQYQYKNGSLTPLGRIHYGVGPARKAINSLVEAHKERSAKKKAEKEEERSRIEKAKKEAKLRLHPERMTEEEIMKDTERARLETQRQEAYRAMNRAKAESNRLNDEIEKSIKDKEKTNEDYFAKNKADMTNEELRDATERKILQKKYEDAVRELRQAKHPLATKILHNMLETSVSTVTNKLVNAAADKVIDTIFKNDPVKKLQTEKNMLELKKQIDKLKKKDEKTDKLKEQKEKLQLEYDVNKLVSDIDKSKDDKIGKLKTEKEIMELTKQIDKLKTDGDYLTIDKGKYKGWNSKEIEEAKNMLIDLNQLLNLDAKVGELNLDEVGKYKKTDRYKEKDKKGSGKLNKGNKNDN